MSTFLGHDHAAEIHSAQELLAYFERGAKPVKLLRVGLECELLGVHRYTGKALTYAGPVGIQEILCAMAEDFGYEPLRDGGDVIALKRGETLIGLEPGGQIELSASPVSTVFEVKKQLDSFLLELRQMRARFPGIEWLAYGIQPFSRLDEIDWVPKSRYAIMARHFASRGSQSHAMMKQTASNQLNFDYLSEEHAMTSLRTAFGITSVVSALFANSSFSGGRPNGFLTARLDIWNHTDPERAGLLVEFTRPDRTFQDYLDYILDVPMIFIVRRGKWLEMPGLTFRSYLKDGFHDEFATLDDFELHLSSIFPEARLKHYLEIRGADGQNPDRIPAVAAFWKGILYDADAQREAWRLVSFASESDRLNLHHTVPRYGLRARLGGKPILPIAQALVELSSAVLSRSSTGRGDDESVFLAEIARGLKHTGQTPAEILLGKWEGEFKKNPGRLIEYLSIG